MKQRVLFFPSWYPTATAPVNGIFVQEQAQLISSVFDVCVLLPSVVIKDAGVESRNDLQSNVRVIRESIVVPYARLPWLSYWLYLKAAKRGSEQVMKLWGRPDLIHAHVVLPAGWAAAQIGRQLGVPVVLTEHTGPFDIQLRTPFHRWLVRETLHSVDAVVAVSPALAQRINVFEPAAKCEVIGNPIQTRFFQLTSKSASSDKLIFLFVGLLTEQKGVAYLLRAAKKVIETGSGCIEVRIGGDGPDREALAKLAMELDICDQTRFLGILTREEVRREMQGCDVFVLSSLHETFGIVLGEAMACGKPVIATRCGGPEYVVMPETGILVPPRNVDMLARAMRDFVEGRVSFDPGQIRASVVQRFGEESFLSNISTVYRRVMGAC